MKCFLRWLFLLGVSINLSAQDTGASNLVEQRYAEERYKALNATVQDLVATQDLLLKRQDDIQRQLERLEKLIEQVRGDGARAQLGFATRDDLKQVVDSVREMEKKRQDDQKVVLESISQLAKEIARTPAPRAAEPKATPRSSEKASSASDLPDHLTNEALVHTIKGGDGNLTAIIKAYNSAFADEGRGQITQQDVVKQNPGMDPNIIVPGRTINIPIPKKK